jgi:hypothetical protein
MQHISNLRNTSYRDYREEEGYTTSKLNTENESNIIERVSTYKRGEQNKEERSFGGVEKQNMEMEYKSSRVDYPVETFTQNNYVTNTSEYREKAPQMNYTTSYPECKKYTKTETYTNSYPETKTYTTTNRTSGLNQGLQGQTVTRTYETYEQPQTKTTTTVTRTSSNYTTRQ